jgi:nucleotide-binding universal stress UspA family protein
VKRYEKLLVALDFSAHSTKALETAIDLAKIFGARILLLHAVHLPPLIGIPDQVMIPPDVWTGVREAARGKLEQYTEKVRAEGVPVEAFLAEAPASDAIVEEARRAGVDLIVMGTRGLTGLKHVLLGSVAERTLRLAPCAVLTVKDEGAA